MTALTANAVAGGTSDFLAEENASSALGIASLKQRLVSGQADALALPCLLHDRTQFFHPRPRIVRQGFRNPHELRFGRSPAVTSRIRQVTEKARRRVLAQRLWHRR